MNVFKGILVWSQENCFRTKKKFISAIRDKEIFYYKKFQKDIQAFVVPSRHSLKIFYGARSFLRILNCSIYLRVTRDQKQLELEQIRKRFDAHKFIYSGRISPEKDLELLIKAFERTLQHLPEAKLLMLGFKDDPYSNSIRQMIKRLGMESSIECKPFVRKEELLALLSDCAYMIFLRKYTIIFHNLSWKLNQLECQ